MEYYELAIAGVGVFAGLWLLAAVRCLPRG